MNPKSTNNRDLSDGYTACAQDGSSVAISLFWQDSSDRPHHKVSVYDYETGKTIVLGAHLPGFVEGMKFTKNFIVIWVGYAADKLDPSRLEIPPSSVSVWCRKTGLKIFSILGLLF